MNIGRKLTRMKLDKFSGGIEKWTKRRAIPFLRPSSFVIRAGTTSRGNRQTAGFNFHESLFPKIPRYQFKVWGIGSVGGNGQTEEKTSPLLAACSHRLEY